MVCISFLYVFVLRTRGVHVAAVKGTVPAATILKLVLRAAHARPSILISYGLVYCPLEQDRYNTDYRSIEVNPKPFIIYTQNRPNARCYAHIIVR